MKRILTGVLGTLVLLGILFVMIGDSAPQPLRGYWQAIFGEGQSIRANAGFANFGEESNRIEDSFACVRITDKPGDEFNDHRRHCVIGEFRTARISIYEPVGHEGLTKKVKLTWLDNLRPNARNRNAPRHADREEVRQVVRDMAKLYVPKQEAELMQMFTQQKSGVVTELPFTAVVQFADRQGFKHGVVEIRDGNHAVLAGSEERQGRPGYEKCLYILGNIPVLANQTISGEAVPERSDLYVTYFLKSNRGEQFLCEIHHSGYYRIRVSQEQGDDYKVMAHGNLGGN